MLGTAGHLAERTGRVTAVKRGGYDGRLYRVTAGGRALRGTRTTSCWPGRSREAGWYLVYLMYRGDRGYRLGLAKSMRPRSAGQEDLGLRVRVEPGARRRGLDPEGLRVPRRRRLLGGVLRRRVRPPTAVYHGLGRDLALSDAMLERLFLELDTASRAKRLMADLDLHPDFPHHRPQNGRNRQMPEPDDVLRPPRSAAYHRVQWSTNRLDLADRLSDAGFAIRPAKGRSVRFETSRKSYVEALTLAKSAAAAAGIGIHRRAAIGDEIYDFVPLSHVRVGMTVLVERDGVLEPARVDAVDGRGLQRAGVRPPGRSDAHLRGERRPGPQQRVQVSRRRHPQHPRVRGRLSRRHPDRPGAELPVDARPSSTPPTRSSPTT